MTSRPAGESPDGLLSGSWSGRYIRSYIFLLPIRADTCILLRKGKQVNKTKKFLLALAALFISLPGCVAKRYDGEALALSREMSLDRKVGQLIMPAVPDSRVTPAVENILRRYHPGGIILFGFNLAPGAATARFIGGMQEFARSQGDIPLFISTDQEGGRVVRMTSGVTQFPGSMAAGVCGDAGLAYRWGRILGLELRRAGVNMNLAPVLDVNNNPRNPVINTRSIGSNPAVVARIGAGYIRGLQDSRCIAVGKHFPGHGDTNKDSHLTLPVIRHDLKRLERVELVPFRAAIKAGVECIMTAHISYPAILGNDDPATVSKEFLTGLLRTRYRFRGLVITDDMEMHAISRRQDIGEAAVRSIVAGADIVLISSYQQNIPAIFNAIKKAVISGRIPAARLDESVRRILEMKMRYGVLSYRKGKTAPGALAITDRDRKFLAEAGRVNEELSRRGILYYGDRRLLTPPGDRRRIFITSSPVLRAVLEEDRRNIICAFRDLGRRAGALKNAVVYLHVVQPDAAYIGAVGAYCASRGFGLVVVSSGNPFPVTVAGLARAGLLSFSDTDESLRQLGRCLNGAFRPAAASRLDLGIKSGT